MKSFFAVIVSAILMFPGLSRAQTMTDEQIAKVMAEANDAEIDMAKMASSRAERAEVKDFAKHMIDEHKQNQKEAKKILKAEKIKPAKSDASAMLKEDVKAGKTDLRKLKNADFDKEYMSKQVAMHQQLLNDLTDKFIPATQNPQFRAFLEETKTHVQSHLAKAQEIQGSLMK